MRKYSFFLKLTINAETHDDALELATIAMDASDLREQDGILNVELVEDIDDMDYDDDDDEFDFNEDYDDIDYDNF